jgi:hypothetical protein
MSVRIVKLDKPTKAKKTNPSVAKELTAQLHDQLSAVGKTCNALMQQGCEVVFRFDPNNGNWDFTYSVKRIDLIGSK